jgi:hypothetical protein
MSFSSMFRGLSITGNDDDILVFSNAFELQSRSYYNFPNLGYMFSMLLQCLAAWEEVLPDMKVVDTTSSYSPSNKLQLQVQS